ncbi:hypothetical protein QTP88_006936 [Uroleucon formosanum]
MRLSAIALSMSNLCFCHRTRNRRNQCNRNLTKDPHLYLVLSIENEDYPPLWKIVNISIFLGFQMCYPSKKVSFFKFKLETHYPKEKSFILAVVCCFFFYIWYKPVLQNINKIANVAFIINMVIKIEPSIYIDT